MSNDSIELLVMEVENFLYASSKELCSS